MHMNQERRRGGTGGASTPPAFFKRGKGDKSALLMKQYISLTTFNSVL